MHNIRMYVYYIFTDCILAGSSDFFWGLVLNIETYRASHHWGHTIASSAHENEQNCGEAFKKMSLSNSRVMRQTVRSITEQLQTKICSSNRWINRCCRISSAPRICRVLFWMHSGEFMLCLPLLERHTGSDIVKAVNGNFTMEDISWVNRIWYFPCVTGCKKYSANPVLPCTVDLCCSASQEFF
jgi:hypothetical protein